MRLPCPTRRRLASALALLFLLAFSGSRLRLAAQGKDKESALSDAEVEKLRDTAYYPPERVLAFIDFLDQRTKGIDKLATGKRQPGREEDIHDLMEQFTSIADDLDDNLDDYGKYHRDIRKVLPKVVAATERWGTALRSPPDHEAYSIQRKLALETLADIHETATKMIDEQKAWFLAHPPPKDDGRKGAPPPRS
jgi:hypothetical protein